MSLLRHCLACLILGGALALRGAEPAAEASPLSPLQLLLPRLSGDLAGDFSLLDGRDLPPVAWRVQAIPDETGRLAPRFELTATAPGLALTVHLTLPAGDQPGTWQLRDGTVALADWWPQLVGRLPALDQLPPDLHLAGDLHVTGAGTWTSPKAWQGDLHLTVSGGSAGSEAQRWSGSDLSLDASLALDGSTAVLKSARVRVPTLQVATISPRNLALEITGAGQGKMEIRQASVELFGGRIALQPFTLDPAAKNLGATADLAGVALGDLAGFVPQALHEASGQVSGRISLHWSLAKGLDGQMEVAPGSGATVKLAESPGLLTRKIGPRLPLLPASWGALSRWVTINNPVYPTIRQVEMGQMPLEVQSLHVDFDPEGDAQGRTAHIELTARPTLPDSNVKSVRFTVNYSGLLEEAIRLGLDRRFNVKVTPGK